MTMNPCFVCSFPIRIHQVELSCPLQIQAQFVARCWGVDAHSHHGAQPQPHLYPSGIEYLLHYVRYPQAALKKIGGWSRIQRLPNQAKTSVECLPPLFIVLTCSYTKLKKVQLRQATGQNNICCRVWVPEGFHISIQVSRICTHHSAPDRFGSNAKPLAWNSKTSCANLVRLKWPTPPVSLCSTYAS